MHNSLFIKELLLFLRIGFIKENKMFLNTFSVIIN